MANQVVATAVGHLAGPGVTKDPAAEPVTFDLRQALSLAQLLQEAAAVAEEAQRQGALAEAS